MILGSLPENLQFAGAFVIAAVVTALAVNPIRTLAARTDFYDRPVGYKQHAQPTPYLGGAAVMAGFLIASIALGSAWSRFAPATLCALLLVAVGTLDDRVGLGIAPRLGAQIAAALVLWMFGTGWDVGNPAADLALTVVWVIGVTNAFNLMDNLDGAAATVGLTSAFGAGALAISAGDPGLAVFALALAGACAGFLPQNLATPSRIFLGDGGSLPIGFLIAAIIMASPPESVGLAAVLAAAPLVGLPIFDTALVVVSRYRRRVTILSGGRDHLTHRLYTKLGSTRRVAMVLAGSQGTLCLLALALHALDPYEVTGAAVGYLICGLIALALLEAPRGARVDRGQEEQPA
jgi:UDP-GlcNAc:undecaprenyl-phosphate GlcNAc-1-phosphate transferase